MKKIIALFLVVVLAFSLVACNMGKNKDKNNSTANPPVNSGNSTNGTNGTNNNSGNNSNNSNNSGNTKNTESMLESMIPDISTNVSTEGQR